LIAWDQVSKRYGGEVALAPLDLEVSEGQFVALVGTSGSGKTTLLKMANRLVEPDSGQVRVQGRDVSQEPAPALRRRIGYAFQGIGLFPHMTVAENIAATLDLLGWSREAQKRRVADLLELVSLPAGYGGRRPADLSGGERQRVGVARALASSPPILLMDEPFGALDPVTRDDLGTACRNLHDRLGLTTVMVTHDIQEAVVLADRIVVLKGGRILADGSPHALLSGHADPDVRAMMDMPRRQAERVRALIGDVGA
jgi:osmoprotectant transport system ATP-binding protein